MLLTKRIAKVGTQIERAKRAGSSGPSKEVVSMTKSEKPIIIAEGQDVTFQVMRECHVEELAEVHAKVWTTGNPVHGALGTTKEIHLPYSKLAVARLAADEDVGIIAVQKQTGKIVGFQLNKDMFAPAYKPEQISELDPIFPKHWRFIHHTHKPWKEL